MRESLADFVNPPKDQGKLYSWTKLTNPSKFAFFRALERTQLAFNEYEFGFSYLLLKEITRENLTDARNVGKKRAEKLLDELNVIFKEDLNLADGADNTLIESYDNFAGAANQMSKTNLDAQIRDVNSLEEKVIKIANQVDNDVLEQILVGTDLHSYLRKIGSHELLNRRIERMLLKRFLPHKSTRRNKKRASEIQKSALSHLLDANLRLSFAIAKQLCTESDIRARILAGNLGLLVALQELDSTISKNLEIVLMEYIRKYILFFIQYRKLSYEDIVQEYLKRNFSQVNNASLLKLIDNFNIDLGNSKTIPELLENLENLIAQVHKLDERDIYVLTKRNEAFGMTQTLDEIGKRWGITRERVRQISEKLSELTIPISAIPLILEQTVQTLVKSESEQQFQYLIVNESQGNKDTISAKQLRALCKLFSLDSLVHEIDETVEKWTKYLQLEAEITSKIRAFRSPMGLIDVSLMAKKLSISETKARQLILYWYPRSIFSGSISLARTQRLDTMFENTLAKQLKVKSPLSFQILIEGLRRTARNRKVVLIGSDKELQELIRSVSGAPSSFQTISSNLLESVSLQRVEEWLVEIFGNTEFGILHSSEITEIALRDGINVSSISVYLSNSPIIRNIGSAVFSLVGTEVDLQFVKIYSQINREKMRPSVIEFEFAEDDKAVLKIQPNLNVIASGIVFPPSEIKSIFVDQEFVTLCSCGQLESIQKVRFTKSGFWTGFTAMIRHGFSNHDYTKETTFKFRFDFRKSEVSLIVPNSID